MTLHGEISKIAHLSYTLPTSKVRESIEKISNEVSEEYNISLDVVKCLVESRILKDQGLEEKLPIDLDDSELFAVIRECSGGRPSRILCNEVNNLMVCVNNSEKIVCPYAVSNLIPLENGMHMCGKLCKRYG